MPENKNLYCYHCFNKIDPDIIGDYCAECGKKHSVHYSQSEELPAGTYLNNGRYFVGESIGSGGFGITYIGFDTKLEKKILIKETFYNGLFKRNVNNKDNPEPLKVTYGKDFSLERIMQKTKKECKGLSEAEGLNNIVKVYDWFSENNTAYIITEFINGVTLDERVRQKGYYSWEELYKKLKPLMQSLSVLHEKGIIHRDIKPQNIMIKNIKGVGEELVLIDFGLARFTGTGSMASRGISFTPGYSPFEQRTFMEQDGEYTDVYALAATIYFALTGQDPNLDLAFTVEENFPKINDLNKYYAVPENITKTLKYALNPKYNNRCGSIDELLKLFDGLESVAEDKHIIINKTINSGESSILMKSRDYISANTVNVNSIEGDKDIFKPDEEEFEDEYFKFDDEEFEDEDFEPNDEEFEVDNFEFDEEEFEDDYFKFDEEKKNEPLITENNLNLMKSSEEIFETDEVNINRVESDDEDFEEVDFDKKKKIEKFIKITLGVVLFLIFFMVLIICLTFDSESEEQEENSYFVDYSSMSSTNSVTAIRFVEPSVSLEVGETVSLDIIVEPESAKDKVLEFKSNDPKIAQIDEMGKLVGVSSGSTTITATLKSDETITASLIVNVTDSNSSSENSTDRATDSSTDKNISILQDYLSKIPNESETNDKVFPTKTLTGKAIVDVDNDGVSELLLRFDYSDNIQVVEMVKVENEKCVVYKTYNNLSELYSYNEGDGSYKNTILVHYTTGEVCMEYRAVVAKDNEKTKNSEQKILSIESGGNLSELVNFKTTVSEGTTKYFVNGTPVEESVYEETLSIYSARYSVWSAWESVNSGDTDKDTDKPKNSDNKKTTETQTSTFQKTTSSASDSDTWINDVFDYIDEDEEIFEYIDYFDEYIDDYIKDK